MKLKHHCKKCGKVIYWKVSIWKRFKELFQNKKPDKVCKECYEEFKEGIK